jgi:hypothetical protein
VRVAQHDFSRPAVFRNEPGRTDSSAFRHSADLGPVVSPDQQREYLVRVSAIEIDEDWRSAAVCCGVRTGANRRRSSGPVST